ncbi:MAG: hypothetical protein QXG10_04910 [Candidatus Hadarchaeales archaeon]
MNFISQPWINEHNGVKIISDGGYVPIGGVPRESFKARSIDSDIQPPFSPW